MRNNLKINNFIKLLIVLVFTLSLNAKDSVYILPNESKDSIKKIEKLIKKSKDKIDIAVYNFEYKKIAKMLRKAADNGVKVNILFEKSKLKNKKAKYDYLCESKNIECKIYKKAKQHIKLIIFDNTTAMFGSANMTKESFKENLELIYFTNNPKIIQKLETNFSTFFNQ
jgi:phosphatidylserine/phosphatidylglycerophosphate/cardiolipin synthase-like enzyme